MPRIEDENRRPTQRPRADSPGADALLPPLPDLGPILDRPWDDLARDERRLVLDVIGAEPRRKPRCVLSLLDRDPVDQDEAALKELQLAWCRRPFEERRAIASGYFAKCRRYAAERLAKKLTDEERRFVAALDPPSTRPVGGESAAEAGRFPTIAGPTSTLTWALDPSCDDATGEPL